MQLNDPKTNKVLLNLNSVKFKLVTLQDSNIRYEIIYKNLVRDLRKFYTSRFKQFSSYHKKKRNFGNDYYLQCLEKFLTSFIPEQEYKLLGVTMEKLVFSMGAIIYPKDMIKCVTSNSEKQDVIRIYYSLYKFSIDRLQKFIDDPAKLYLFALYVNREATQRIEQAENMRKYSESYREGIQVLFRESRCGNAVLQSLNMQLI